jgi:serine/threonine protein kinase
VAIKRTDLQADVLNDEYEKERLRAEAHLMSEMSHPNIVALYGVCVTAKRGEQQLLLVMEACQFSLKAYLDNVMQRGKDEEADERARVVGNGFKLTEMRLMKLLQEITAGMRYLHDRQPPIIHRDLKPGNVSVLFNLHDACHSWMQPNSCSDSRLPLLDTGVNRQVAVRQDRRLRREQIQPEKGWTGRVGGNHNDCQCWHACVHGS